MPLSISVVIPALNEAARIEDTLRSVHRQQGPFDVVVVDGGSSDDTTTRAAPYARVLATPRGRARQMNAGAATCPGDVLLFLHADTRLPGGAFEAIREALHAPGTVGGVFRLRFDRTSPLLAFYGFCTRFPIPRLCFGDRGLFVRRSAFEALGGFPEIPLFEDLEMVRRMQRAGTLRFLPQAVTTAARRFDRHGRIRQQLRNAYLWTHYLRGTDPHHLAHLYRYEPEQG